MEKKKERLIKAGYNHHPSAFMGTGVKQGKLLEKQERQSNSQWGVGACMQYREKRVCERTQVGYGQSRNHVI